MGESSWQLSVKLQKMWIFTLHHNSCTVYFIILVKVPIFALVFLHLLMFSAFLALDHRLCWHILHENELPKGKQYYGPLLTTNCTTVHCLLTTNCTTVRCLLTTNCTTVHCLLTTNCTTMHCLLTTNCTTVHCLLTTDYYVPLSAHHKLHAKHCEFL